MVAVFDGQARKRTAGQLLLAMGGAAFFLQVWALWLETGASLSSGAAQSLGWLGALGMAALQTIDFLAWHPNGVLLGAARMLLLFWPVAVMIAGAVIARKAD